MISKQVVVMELDKDDDGGFDIGDTGKVVSVDSSGCEVLFKHDKLPFYLYHWQIEEVK